MFWTFYPYNQATLASPPGQAGGVLRVGSGVR